MAHEIAASTVMRVPPANEKETNATCEKVYAPVVPSKAVLYGCDDLSAQRPSAFPVKQCGGRGSILFTSVGGRENHP
jgi:hypothetical protein